MIKIAHRGNFNGKNPKKENTIEYLHDALRAGYSVEVDIYHRRDAFWLGHDEPGEHVDLEFLEDPRIWVHAKNTGVIHELWHHPLVNVFWHDKDDFTFTSHGFKWANPNIITHDGIMVMPECGKIEIINDIRAGILKPLGVCSDNFAVLGI